MKIEVLGKNYVVGDKLKEITAQKLSKLDKYFDFHDREDYPFNVIYNLGITDINFADITILYGNNGSGKSTLLNIIGGIDNADSGYISINGEKTADMSESALTMYRRKHLGYIFQMYNL